MQESIQITPEHYTVRERVILYQAMQIIQANLTQRGGTFEHSRDVRAFLTMKLAGLESEQFCAMFLDNRHRLIEFEVLFQGTINGASVYPREVAKRALAHNAAAVIFAHNHPSGVPEPSSADEALTARLKQALGTLEIRVLDHFIVGDGINVVSFSERGIL